MTQRAIVLCPNLSGNSLGRALALAELLADRYEVRVMGHMGRGGLWAPARHSHIPIQALRGRNLPGLLWNWRRNLADMDCDVLIASKPLPATLLYASYFLHRRPHTSVLLDVDDDELGLMRRRPFFKRHLQGVLRIFSLRGYYHALWAQQLARGFRRVLCASTRLQRQHGGIIIYHARRDSMISGGTLEPRLAERLQALQRRKTVLFLGTPRGHKGIEVLARAVAKIDDPQVQLAVVGCKCEAEAQAQLGRWLPPERLQCIQTVPLDTVSAWLKAATVVVIPQQREEVAEAQTPAKLFDAMCCGVPLVSTQVGDIPLIVGDAALLVEQPDDAGQLAAAIQRLLDDPQLRTEMGHMLATRFARLHSFEAAQQRLFALCQPEPQVLGGQLEMRGT
ncbi:MAG: glycosyltransferase family 4 protein [Steroidobacteraceae bacterium]